MWSSLSFQQILTVPDYIVNLELNAQGQLHIRQLYHYAQLFKTHAVP